MAINITENGDLVTVSADGGDLPRQIRLTFTSSQVGNGSNNDATSTAPQDGGLAVRLQEEDASGGLVAATSRFRDEGVTFASSTPGLTFDVRDLVSGVARGDRFEVVVLGTAGADTMTATQNARPYYFNGGAGADIITDGTANDFLVGGAGDDVLTASQGDDSFIGGGGNDTLTGGAGSDRAIFNVSTDGADQVNLGEGADTVSVTAASAGQIRLTFTSAEVGNGSSGDATGTAPQDGGLAVRLQLEDGSGALTGGVSRFDDEGITFVSDTAGLTFDVRDLVSGVGRGDRFEVVTLGTDAADTMTAVQGARSYYFNAGGGADTITGGTANDFLVGGGGDDVLTGGEGSDSFLGGGGADTMNGGTGDDNIQGLDGNDSGFGGDGNDFLLGGTGNDILNGDAGDDQISGDIGADTLSGGDGNDTLSGGNDNDVLNGAAGADSLFGNQGNDTVNGEAGDDLVAGQMGDDVLSGGIGNDVMTGGAGVDQLFGGDGDDFIEGNADADRIQGNLGRDRLFGGQGSDVVAGGQGDDVVTGGAGDDDITGDFGNDDLYGDADPVQSPGDPSAPVTGADRIEGGQGADFLFGGGGADVFVFQGRTPGTGDSPGSSNYFRTAAGTQGADVIADFSRTDGDVLDFFVSGSGQYVETGTVASSYADALLLANNNLAQNSNAIFSAVGISSSVSGASGVLLFFETSGDDVADQQVFLQGVTVADLANDGSFIV